MCVCRTAIRRCDHLQPELHTLGQPLHTERPAHPAWSHTELVQWITSTWIERRDLFILTYLMPWCTGMALRTLFWTVSSSSFHPMPVFFASVSSSCNLFTATDNCRLLQSRLHSDSHIQWFIAIPFTQQPINSQVVLQRLCPSYSLASVIARGKRDVTIYPVGEFCGILAAPPLLLIPVLQTFRSANIARLSTP